MNTVVYVKLKIL